MNKMGDIHGNFSITGQSQVIYKVRYNLLSYHAVQDEDGHGYGYWLIYDYSNPNYELIGIHQIDTY